MQRKCSENIKALLHTRLLSGDDEAHLSVPYGRSRAPQKTDALTPVVRGEVISSTDRDGETVEIHTIERAQVEWPKAPKI